MHKNHARRTKILAQSALGRVETCACGTLTVHLGPFALRLHRNALEPLAQMFTHAVAAQRLEMKRERDDLALFLGESPTPPTDVEPERLN